MINTLHDLSELVQLILGVIIVSILCLVLGIVLAGCTTTPSRPLVPVTAPVNSQLDQISSHLSRVDGKAIIIQQWINNN